MSVASSTSMSIVAVAGEAQVGGVGRGADRVMERPDVARQLARHLRARRPARRGGAARCGGGAAGESERDGEGEGGDEREAGAWT